jgi:YggT family protein
MSPLLQASLFLIDTAFTFLILAVLLRILLQWIYADFYNPISQMVLRTSNFLVIPLRRIIPAYYGIDWASFILLLLLGLLKQGLLVLVQTGIWVNTAGLMLLGIADILGFLFYIYLFSMIVIVVASWLNPTSTHPLVQIASQLVSPLLNRIRGFLPPLAGFDLSPLLLTIVLILFNILVVQVIAHQGIILIIP